jgi:hypothetical protein
VTDREQLLDELRSVAFAIAYRMLGSVSEAEEDRLRMRIGETVGTRARGSLARVDEFQERRFSSNSG